jgi:hypothetical protein
MSTSALTPESSVSQAVETLRTAILQADGPTLEALAAEGLTYGHSNAGMDDRATFLKKLSGDTPAFRSISISNQAIIVSGSTAVVRHTFAAVTADGGEVNLHNLLVWVEQNGAWKLLARQAVRLP